MEPAAFKRWRKALGLSQKEAAKALGLKRRIVQYYEKGERDGKDVEIPKSVRLACYALSIGIEDYTGPPKPEKGGHPEVLSGDTAEALDAVDALVERAGERDDVVEATLPELNRNRQAAE